jgi:hypothetical protein
VSEGLTQVTSGLGVQAEVREPHDEKCLRGWSANARLEAEE